VADDEARMVEAGIRTVNAILAPTSVSNTISYKYDPNAGQDDQEENEYGLIVTS
jgi:hypothetical protein